MPDRPESTAPSAVSPPRIDPKRWEDFPTFRESFLRMFTEPEANAALRAFGMLLFNMALEFSHVMPDEPGGYTRHDARAAVADSRCLQGFLRYIGEQLEDFDTDAPENAEPIRLAKLAARLSPRVGRIADAIEGELQ